MQERKEKIKVIFGIQLDKDLKTRLKLYCAKKDMTLTSAIEEAIEEYLTRRNA